jgi:hypothetical protein
MKKYNAWNCAQKKTEITANSNKEYNYFKTEGDRYIFALTQTDGSTRCNLIGLDEELYYNQDKAQKWYENISKKIHPINNKDNAENAMNAMNKLNGLYSRMLECFEDEDGE